MDSSVRRYATMLLICLACIAALVMGSPATAVATDLQVVELRCEYLVNPLAIDQPAPRLSWRLESQQRGARQTAYRILVASSRELLSEAKADLWDSGKVDSRETVNIAYQGKPLASRATCYWQVHIWGQAEEPCEVDSEVSQWTMGLLAESDWQADYISYRDESPVFTSKEELYLPPAYQYRKEFQATEKPDSASDGLRDGAGDLRAVCEWSARERPLVRSRLVRLPATCLLPRLRCHGDGESREQRVGCVGRGRLVLRLRRIRAVDRHRH